MRRILELASKLKDFPDDPKIASIVEELRTIETLSEVEHIQKVELLRNKLKEITETSKNMGLKINGIVLADLTYEMLIALAETYPLNDRDPITQRSLTEKDDDDDAEEEIVKIAISTGQIFNLNSLIQYHNVREYRGSDLGETDQSKWLLNPINNTPFNVRDLARIQAAAQINFIPIENLKTVADALTEGEEIVDDYYSDLFKKGERLLTLAASFGHADAAFFLAKIYFNDKLVYFRASQDLPPDYQLGLNYLTQAIELGHPEARIYMAKLMIGGDSELAFSINELGLPHNPEEGKKILDTLIDEDFLPAIMEKLKLLMAENSSDKKLILSLLEKGSTLGDKDCTVMLTDLYNGKEVCGITLDENPDEAMHHLHIAMQQGDHNATNSLVNFYLDQKNDVRKAVEILEVALHHKTRWPIDDHHKGQYARKIAQLYLSDETIASPVERLAKVKEYYVISAYKYKATESIAEYGALFLVGNSALGLEPDHEKADRIFHRLENSSDANLVAKEIARSADASTENISRYLFWLFKDIENRVDWRHGSHAVFDVIHLLDTGHTSQGGILSAAENKVLANKWKDFSKHPFISYQYNESIDEDKTIKFPSQEFNRLLHETYNHFGLPCPFEKLSEPGSVVQYTGGGMTLAFGYARELNSCTLFSGRSFRQVPDAEVTDRPGVGTPR